MDTEIWIAAKVWYQSLRPESLENYCLQNGACYYLGANTNWMATIVPQVAEFMRKGPKFRCVIEALTEETQGRCSPEKEIGFARCLVIACRDTSKLLIKKEKFDRRNKISRSIRCF